MSISRKAATISRMVGMSWIGVEPGRARRRPSGRRGWGAGARCRPRRTAGRGRAAGGRARGAGGRGWTPLAEDVAGAGGVVVGDEDEPARGCRAFARGDDVLGGAAEEQRAGEVEAGVEVEVGRGGGQRGRGRSRSAGSTVATRLPAIASAAWIRWTTAYWGWTKSGLDLGAAAHRPKAAGEHVRRRAAPRRFRAPAPRTSRARESPPCVPPRPPAGDYRGGGAPALACGAASIVLGAPE